MRQIFERSRMGTPSIGMGPIYYGARNDSAAEVSVESVIIYGITITVYLAFILSVISSRKRRISTFTIGSIMIFSGYSLGIAFYEPEWFVGRAEIMSSYCMFNPSMIVKGQISLHVGLTHFNVTYKTSDMSNVSYNNRFDLVFGGRHNPNPDQKLKAVEKGLPNPMVIVAEYMGTDGGGFHWGNCFPTAGYYAQVPLTYAVLSMGCSLIFLILLPTYLPFFFLITGSLMVFSNIVYALNVPPFDRTGQIYVEGIPLDMDFGRTFYQVLVCGLMNITLAFTIFALKKCKCFKNISTFLELDYDTPWDNRIIKEDSEAKRKATIARLSTQFYVDSKIRASVRRFRESIKSKRRAVSQGDKPAFRIHTESRKPFVEVDETMSVDLVEVQPLDSQNRRRHSAIPLDNHLDVREDIEMTI